MSNKYSMLNLEQRKAVFHTKGPLLILAGAGSGKTRVLTHRIAFLIEEEQVKPWQILAITFTNKAAKEMRERVDKLLGSFAEDIWVSTFHSTCVRILRRHIDKIGYDRYFTIYDTDDQKRLIRECLKQLNIDPKLYKESSVLAAISSAKDKMMIPSDYIKQAVGLREETVAKVYELYQKKLMKNNALDFNDLLFKTVELFQSRPDVLEEYRDKFQYIMVDEYQDTNRVQYAFVSLLASKHQNLCVVGDDDQSIYRFRGADIRNILEFEKDFPNACVIKLEQNYRSTQNILDTANHVIGNNYGRKVKRLWTDKEKGELIDFKSLQSEHAEARYVAEEIVRQIEDNGRDYKDFAILYRTNAQSRVLEEKFISNNIPYKIIGGISFYQRKEIKDVLAYLRTVNNSTDDIAVKRIINVPKRGIGLSTISRIEAYADANDIDFFDACEKVSEIPGMTRSANKVKSFVNLIKTLRVEMETFDLIDLVNAVMDRTSYIKNLEIEGTLEAEGRIENIGELISKVTEYQKNTEAPTLNGFLEEVALIADIDAYNDVSNYVVLMTIHSAKGLEFPFVFLTGMEDGLFPSYMSISSGEEEDVEEERRLCYVAITRAMQKLYISSAKTRMIRGLTQSNPFSRFISEMPDDLLDRDESMTNDEPENTRVHYSRKNNSFFNVKPYQTNTYKPSAKPIPNPKSFVLDYDKGDLVMHAKFGIGEVLEITSGGADYQVKVNFPSAGVKKLLAKLSNLKKID